MSAFRLRFPRFSQGTHTGGTGDEQELQILGRNSRICGGRRDACWHAARTRTRRRLTTAAREPSGSSTATGASWRCSTPGPGTSSPRKLVGAGAHDICISERARKAYITAETINTVTTVDTKTLAKESIAVSPLPHHIEPSHDGRTIYVSLASHTPTAGSAAIRGHRHRRQLGQLHDHQRQPGGAVTRSSPVARRREGLHRARSRRRGLARRRRGTGDDRLQHHANPEGGGS